MNLDLISRLLGEAYNCVYFANVLSACNLDSYVRRHRDQLEWVIQVSLVEAIGAGSQQAGRCGGRPG